jgi:class 3 adenylate cyclase
VPDNELRQDRVSGEWAVIAPSRSKRPRKVTLLKPRETPATADAACPFCHGNEAELLRIIAEYPTAEPPIEVQREFEARAQEEPEAPVRIRIGIHTGEAIVDAGGDLFGKHIILTARIANLAHGGQILASSITKEITSSRGDLEFGEAQDVTLKGIEGTYQVYEVIWSETDEEPTKASS